jgi:non-ribosomal peptide synthetase component F
VVVEHSAVSSYLQSTTDYNTPGVDVSSRFLLSSPLTSDMSGHSIFPTLILGGCIVLVPKHALLDELELIITSLDVTHIYMTPSLFDTVARKQLPSLRTVCLGGERMLQQHVDLWASRTRLVNGYGPTENTMACTTQEYGDGEMVAAASIGRPVPNTTCYVLDPRLQPVPLGVIGELYLGGSQLARGYLNRPELTRKAFISNPFAPGERLYKTGDTVKRLPSGSILYLGRNDDQVKIRGFRVELGEVESAMVTAGAGRVNQAVAIVDDGGALVGFVSPADVPTSSVKTAMRSTLPAHMVPATIVALESIPMSSAGKADKKALKSVLQSSGSAIVVDSVSSVSITSPATPVEEAVLSIYREEIGSQTLGVTSDFFESGGDSLKAVRIVARLRTLPEERPDLGIRDGFSSLSVTDLFQNATVRALLQTRVEKEDNFQPLGGEPVTPTCIIPRSPEHRLDPAPASFQQEQMFVLAQTVDNPAAYNIPTVLRVEGALQEDALLRAIDCLIGRHDVLRCTLHPSSPTSGVLNAGVEQRFSKPSVGAPGMRMVEVGADSDTNLLWKELESDVSAPFDISEGPLVRSSLFKVGRESYILCVTCHHAVSDGWSSPILFKELFTIYNALAADGREVALPQVAVQYSDFAIWQRELATPTDVQISYWRRQLQGIEPLELPLDKTRPAVMTNNGDSVPFILPGRVVQKLQDICRTSRCTLFNGLMAAFQILLARYSGNAVDMVVGTPYAGRGEPELQDMIGYFVNTLALRLNLSGDPSFSEVLTQCQLVLAAAMRNSSVPFAQIVQSLGVARDPSRTSVFQAMLLVEAPSSHSDLELYGGVRVSSPTTDDFTKFQQERLGQASEKFELTMCFTLDTGNVNGPASDVQGSLQYNTDLFNRSTIETMCTSFVTLLESAVAEPSKAVWDLPLLTLDARHQLLVRWNDTAKPLPKPGRLLHELFLDQVELTPDGIALLEYGGDKRSVTYRELKSMADKVAKKLRALGVGADETVGLLMTNETAEAIAGVMGVLMAGGAYVPLDPGYPHERISLIEKDAGFKAVLVRDGDILQNLQGVVGCPLINVLDVVTSQDLGSSSESEDSGWRAPSPNSACYVIYTSGACVL